MQQTHSVACSGCNSVVVRHGSHLRLMAGKLRLPHRPGGLSHLPPTALAGLRDDVRHLQISAPVQAGNCGGPLLDANGNLVGTVISKLNAMKVVQATRDMPQNVNFAIKSSVVASFLESRGITYEATTSSNILAPADLADHANSMSVMILCK